MTQKTATASSDVGAHDNETLGWSVPLLLLLAGGLSEMIVKTRRKSRWMVSPSVDFVLVCGGFIWLFMAGYFVLGEIQMNWLSDYPLLLAGALIFTDTHFGASYVSASKVARYKMPLWLVMGGLSTAAWTLAWRFAPLIVLGCKVYLYAVVLHYAHQALVLLKRYTIINQYPWAIPQELALTVLIYALAVHAVLVQLANSQLLYFLNLDLPAWPAPPEWTIIVSEVLIALAASTVMVSIIRNAVVDKRQCPLPFLLLLLTTVTLFSISDTISRVLWLFVPAFFHGSQSIVGIASTWQPTEESRSRFMVSHLILSFILGATLMFLVPFALSSVVGLSKTLAYAAVVLVVSVWHFICDGLIAGSQSGYAKRTVPTVTSA